MVKNNEDRKVLVSIQNLKKYFPVGKPGFREEQDYVKANDDISIDIFEGETFGLVGESGCGKSTLGRALLQLYPQTDGRTLYYGRNIYEVEPLYVLNILEDLPAKRNELKELQKNELDAEKAYNSLGEGDDNAFEELEKAHSEARNAFRDISQLIGGFMLAEDMDHVSKILLNEYKAGVKVAKHKSNIEKAETNIKRSKEKLEKKKDNNGPTTNRRIEDNLQKIKSIEVELKTAESELENINIEIEKELEKYSDDPKFEDYESRRDKAVDLSKLTKEEMRLLRKDLQYIFQDPYSSLNPRLTVGQIISEGLHAHGLYAKHDQRLQDYIIETMEQCGLASYFIHRYPHQFSGGQRQRIGIARSVALPSKFIVCDEPVSALDVSIQSQIINLLLNLKTEEDLTYMFISHDLSVVKYISDRVAVMYLGSIVELADTVELYERPMHPYTEALMSAIPTTDITDTREAIILEGGIPSSINPPSGCKFHTRCPYRTDICVDVIPEFEEARPGHFVACHHKLNVD